MEAAEQLLQLVPQVFLKEDYRLDKTLFTIGS